MPKTPKTLCYSVPRIEQKPFECGPSALAMLFASFGDPTLLFEILKESPINFTYGVADGEIGASAIKYGYRATIYPSNLYIFDPSWFRLASPELITKLRARLAFEKDVTRQHWIKCYIKFLRVGGKIIFKPLDKELLLKLLAKRPYIVGLSSTYLYCNRRVDREKKVSSDISGERAGHFLVVSGYNPKSDTFSIVDPAPPTRLAKKGRYRISSTHLLNAMFMGEATYDCTIIDIKP